MLTQTGPRTPHGVLRIPGRGGAALLLEAREVAAGWQEAPSSGLALDIVLVDPERYVGYRARSTSRQALEELESFLLRAAADLHPEQSLPAFQDREAGLILSVTGSTELEVQLEVQVADSVFAEDLDYDGIVMITTRAALVSAAQHVPGLREAPVFIDAEL